MYHFTSSFIMAFQWCRFLLLFAPAFAGALLQRDEVIARCKGVSREDLEPCLIKLINDMRPNFENGMPEFSLPTVKDLEFGGFNVTENQDDNNHLYLSVSDMKIKGFEDTELTKLKVDYEKQDAHWEVTIPELYVQARYEIDAHMTLVRLQGKGTMWVKLNNVNVGGVHTFKPSDDKTHLIIKGTLKDVKPETVALRLNNIYENNPILKEEAEAYLNRNGQHIFQYMKPKIMSKLNQVLNDYGDRTVTTIPLADVAGKEFISV